MFREKLHSGLDALSPSPELLDRVSEMMAEEARRPKPKIYMSAVKYGGMAAAVCLIVLGAVALGGRDNTPGTQENMPVVTLSSTNDVMLDESFVPTTENMREESFNGSFDSIVENKDKREEYEYLLPRSRVSRGYRNRPLSTM